MLLNEYFESKQIHLYIDGWKHKSWKPNHHAWGNDTHTGCFKIEAEGKRGRQFRYHFRIAVARAAAIFNMPANEIRYAFTKALEDFQFIAIRDNEMNIGYHATVSNQDTPDEIRAVLKQYNFYGSLHEGQQEGSLQPTVQKKSKKSKRQARREHLKAWNEKYAVLPGERPKRISVSHLSKTSLSMLVPEVAAGLPADMVKDFRDWCKRLNELNTGKTLDEKIDGFLSDSWEEWTAETPVSNPLHDAHLLEFRKRRAARLRKLREVAQREGQGRFHMYVLAYFAVCDITGITESLEAAHIVPDSSHDYMHASNGIALVSFLHRAFDDLFFSINPLTLAVFVDTPFRGWLNIHGVQLRDGNIWKLDRSALAHHWERFRGARYLYDAT
mgnify:CR=1 FL=1